MSFVLVWVVARRVVLAEWAEQLRKELAEAGGRSRQRSSFSKAYLGGDDLRPANEAEQRQSALG
ncbi:hypothetical protein [Streptomyces sp. NPDC001816]|uniref:hypothetical protein n=1 Tax=Streptomyces sp. NPDC001816 TaxID=3364612 RepID=UPI0036BD7744